MAGHTVIGLFDSEAEAQQAIEILSSRGVSRDRIDVSNTGSGAMGTSSGSAGEGSVNPVSGSARDENSVRETSDGRTVDEKGRNTNKFTDFFNNLFGGGENDNDSDDAGRYSHVAQNANTIVTVHAQDREEAEDAATILDQAGAIDVDERATNLGYMNTRSSESMGERQNITEDRDRSTGEGSMRMRSRIVDRPIQDHFRLRDSMSGSNMGTGNLGGSSGTAGRSDMDDLSTRGL
jgi:hypothetical protein